MRLQCRPKYCIVFSCTAINKSRMTIERTLLILVVVLYIVAIHAIYDDVGLVLELYFPVAPAVFICGQILDHWKQHRPMEH